MHTLVIINPHSGETSNLSEVASRIRHHPAMEDPDVRITGAPGDAGLFASAGVERGFRRIFAAGGDGTLNEVVNGVMEAGEEEREGLILGVLPLGTGNDFARALHLPLGLDDALDRMEALEPAVVDIVRVSGPVTRYCVNASAGGFSGEVDERVTRDRKRSWGPLAYARGALDVLPDPVSYRVELELDGETRSLDALNIVVSNGRTVAGGVPVAPDASPADGRVDVLIVRDAGLSQLALLGPHLLAGSHLDHDLTEHALAAEVRVRSEPPMPFNVDGELVGHAPVEYEVVPGALRFLAAAGPPPGP